MKGLGTSIPAPYSVALTLAERINLINLLPQQGDAILLRRVQQLNERLLPSDEESEKWKVTASNGQFQWSQGVDTTATVFIGETMLDKIAEILKGKNSAGQMTLVELPLYEKFVEASNVIELPTDIQAPEHLS